MDSLNENSLDTLDGSDCPERHIDINPELYIVQAQFFEEKNDLERALFFYKKVTQILPNNWENYVAIARIYQQLEKWKDVVTVSKQAISLNPDSDSAWNYLSVALNKLGQKEDVNQYSKQKNENAQNQEFSDKNKSLNSHFHIGTLRNIDSLPSKEINYQEEEIKQKNINNPDWENEFDYNFYVSYYQDARDLNPQEAKQHWLNQGKNEERLGSLRHLMFVCQACEADIPSDFDYQKYAMLNPDLANNGISGKWSLIEHWLKYGKHEERKYKRCLNDINQTKKSLSNVQLFGCRPTDHIFTQIANVVHAQIASAVNYPLPSLDLIQLLGSSTISHYKESSIFYTQDLIQQCMLNRNGSVLDIGCGTGRIAQPLLRYLNYEGKYYGLEVNPKMTKWCKNNLSIQNSNFKFFNLPLNNNYYYQDDNGLDNKYNFSCLENTKFTCVVALSIFNHLKLEDVVQYFKLISLVLEPHGVAYITFWVIDDEFMAFNQRTGMYEKLKEDKNGVWYGYEKHSFFAGYSQILINQHLNNFGLQILASSPGSWAEKRNARIYPDWFLIGRKTQLKKLISL